MFSTHQPIIVVQYPCFARTLQSISKDVDLVIPSRHNIRHRVVEMESFLRTQAVRLLHDSTSKKSLTTDAWPVVYKGSIIAAVNWIDKHWNKQHVILVLGSFHAPYRRCVLCTVKGRHLRLRAKEMLETYYHQQCH